MASSAGSGPREALLPSLEGVESRAAFSPSVETVGERVASGSLPGHCSLLLEGDGSTAPPGTAGEKLLTFYPVPSGLDSEVLD